MKHLTLALALLSLTACTSSPKREGYQLPPAMSEVFRNGELRPLQQADGTDLGAPIADDQVSHTCISTPLYHLDGTYWRTKVRCW